MSVGCRRVQNLLAIGQGILVGSVRTAVRSATSTSKRTLEMLQWTTLGRDGARLGLLLHHDDAEREYAYDRQSSVGKLDRALDAADGAGWVVVSMKNDWNAIFAED